MAEEDEDEDEDEEEEEEEEEKEEEKEEENDDELDGFGARRGLGQWMPRKKLPYVSRGGRLIAYLRSLDWDDPERKCLGGFLSKPSMPSVIALRKSPGLSKENLESTQFPRLTKLPVWYDPVGRQCTSPESSV